MEPVGSEEQPKFVMDTITVPEGVDPELAAQRTALIEGWRSGDSDAEQTMRSLMALYWDNQQAADGLTRNYLMASSYLFPAEAGIPSEIADRIYSDSFRNH